ncbi:phosphatidylserine decarboxylase [Bacillus sp. B15-48]|uniref:phosphatidylserine decarboxylase n=1 Tax=Bacillus sp. B15-48 TaxID=1548601 RepID=UPI00193F0F1B|nr:phosphatidylserine decarboxylase [Bacillus sp. B15-48]MBM4762371.1 phosphatidylserine decarboxylase [Bacillus sp. B15-48]
MIQTLYRLMIELTNRKWSSNLLRRFTQSRLSKRVIPAFARTYQINQDEMEKALHAFTSLHEFFTRKLKPGVRTIADETEAIVSPVDAIIEDIGLIEPDHMIKVKGKTYSIAEMLGSEETAEHYKHGTYMILYLSPSHYHRIHSPISGTVINQWTLGDRSYPVNRLGLKYGKETLAKNFRTITEIKYDTVRIALVKVGAMFVNSIETVHEREELIKGEEIAYFTFGSTVVLLFEENRIRLRKDIQLPHSVQMGEKIGELK